MGPGTDIPRVSVLMAVYNNAAYLPAAIDAILAQSFTDFEFLIVDDGSTDGSGAIIDGYAARDARIRAIHQENRGFIASLNRMLGEARGDLIGRMDGDDRCTPDRIERQIAFLDAHPDYGVVGTQTCYFDNAGREWPMARPYPLDDAAFRVALATPYTPLMNHASVLMRADLLRTVGGYRPQFRYCEDLDLWLRLSEVTKLANLPDALTYYRQHAGQVSDRNLAVQTAWAAMAWISHEQRKAGQRDTLGAVDPLPGLDGLGAVEVITGRPGDSQRVRASVIERIEYPTSALAGPGFRVLIDYVRAGGRLPKGWKMVARLAQARRWRQAARLATALLRT